MSEIFDDYQELLSVEVGQRREWVQRKYPDGAYLQWWFGLAGCARGEGKIELGVGILELGIELRELKPIRVVTELARFAVLVAQLGMDLREVPFVATPDGLARRLVEEIPMTADESIEVADRRRNEIINDPRAMRLPGDATKPLPLPADPGIDDLQSLESALGMARPLVDSIRDQGLADEVRSWLDLMDNRWDMSETVNRVFHQRSAGLVEPDVDPGAGQ
jgi:hypothetical protein